MEFRPRVNYLAPFIKWWWLILLTLIAAEAAVLYTLYTLPPAYKTSVKLQVVAPGPREVPLFGETRPSVVRDEVFLVQNNFIEIIKSDAIAQRAASELGLSVSSLEIPKKLTISPVPNTDFLYVYLEWRNPDIAPKILAAEVRLSQEYFARSRAKPASNARQFISQQLVMAKSEMDLAEKNFDKFKVDHRIASVEQEMKSLQDVITSLRLERDRALARGEGPVSASLDRSLTERLRQMAELIATGSEYNNLEATVKRAEGTYEFLLEKEGEAVLKENESLSVEFIQILEEPRAPATLVPPRTREIAILGGLGGLVLGSLFALALGVKATSKEDAVVEGIKKGAVDVYIKTPAAPEASRPGG